MSIDELFPDSDPAPTESKSASKSGSNASSQQTEPFADLEAAIAELSEALSEPDMGARVPPEVVRQLQQAFSEPDEEPVLSSTETAEWRDTAKTTVAEKADVIAKLPRPTAKIKPTTTAARVEPANKAAPAAPAEDATATGMSLGLLDFLKPSPVFVTLQGYRDIPLDQNEVVVLNEHLDSWRGLLARHGVIYDGIVFDGKSPEYVDLIYNLSTAVDPQSFPAALPLLEDALYELQAELQSVEWEIHSVEQIVTRLAADAQASGLVNGPRIYPQHVKGKPAPSEDGKQA